MDKVFNIKLSVFDGKALFVAVPLTTRRLSVTDNQNKHYRIRITETRIISKDSNNYNDSELTHVLNIIFKK